MRITLEREDLDRLAKDLTTHADYESVPVSIELLYDVLKNIGHIPDYGEAVSFDMNEPEFDDMICELIKREDTSFAYYLVQKFK